MGPSRVESGSRAGLLSPEPRTCVRAASAFRILRASVIPLVGLIVACVAYCISAAATQPEDPDWDRSRGAPTDSSTTSQNPEDKTGLPIGQVAPAFTLTDQHGQQVSLASLLQKGTVAIVFHRSVDWCMYCKLQMIQLQRVQGEIEAAGGSVVGISYDSAETLGAYAKRHSITFPLLSDVGSKTIDAYDIRYKEAPPETSGFARHATFILDQHGVIRSKLFRLSYQERPAVDALIDALKEARKAGEAKS